MELLLLGTAGWIPSDTRETCCAMVRHGSEALVIDAGTGLRRLLTDRSLLDGVDHVTIVLSHFHLDHTAGLTYVPALPRSVQVEVIGPGAVAYGRPTVEILGDLLRSPLFPVPVARAFAAVHDLEASPLAVAGQQLTWRVQERHSDPTIGYRIGDAVTYCTDTAHDPATVEFARGSRVLVHEAVYAGDRSPRPDHSSSGEAATIARDAGVERLVLMHRSLEPPTDEELLEAAVAVFPATELSTDGFVVRA
jgi:ribonuclease BN (tRNA processing enzyme)